MPFKSTLVLFLLNESYVNENKLLLQVARALSADSRLSILAILDKAPDGLRVVEIAQAVGYSEQAVCFHLAILSKAGMLIRVRKGCRWRYSLSDTRYSVTIQKVRPS
jgi:DNA-binding transcriptional ArsR family regulator